MITIYTFQIQGTTLSKHQRIYEDAAVLLKQYGLAQKGWSFELSNQKRRVGECDHLKLLIRYSSYFLEKTSSEEIRDTLLHEIAHALVGPGHGHDIVWKRKAIELGARPKACTNEAKTTAKPNFVIECDSCGKRWYRYRLRRSLHNRRSSCCRANLKFYKVRTQGR